MSETNRCDGPSRTPVYYEEETSEPLGAQCKNASSDASKLATQTDDDAKLRDYLRTKAIDPPLADDVIGNMIPGMIAGGAAAAVHHLAATSSITGVGHAVAAHAAKDLATDAVKHAVTDSIKNTMPYAPKDVAKRSSEPSTVPVVAGTSKDAASVPVPSPVRSEEPPVVGRDRAPYAPGKAPVRIPEAPLPVVIRG